MMVVSISTRHHEGERRQPGAAEHLVKERLGRASELPPIEIVTPNGRRARAISMTTSSTAPITLHATQAGSTCFGTVPR